MKRCELRYPNPAIFVKNFANFSPQLDLHSRRVIVF
jgi:hypothetical protein